MSRSRRSACSSKDGDSGFVVGNFGGGALDFGGRHSPFQAQVNCFLFQLRGIHSWQILSEKKNAPIFKPTRFCCKLWS
jgi:hypothetical protein